MMHGEDATSWQLLVDQSILYVAYLRETLKLAEQAKQRLLAV